MENVQSHVRMNTQLNGPQTLRVVGSATLVVFISVALTFSQTQRGERMVSDLRRNVVRIEAKLRTGPENGWGFVVGERAGRLYIVTAYHVVAEPQAVGAGNAVKVRVEFYDRRGKMYDAELLGTHDTVRDLAVLTVPTPPGFEWTRKCLAGAKKQERGSPVWFVGRDQEWKPPVVPGHVLAGPSTEWLLELEGMMVKRGSSGGPVISDTGIIGMVQGDSEEGTHALSIDFIKKLFEEWNHPWELRAAEPVEPAPRETPVGPLSRQADLDAIKKVLYRYADSYNRKDKNALWKIWPSAPAGTKRTIEKAFSSARSITMNLQPNDPEIEPDGASATVTAQYSQEYAGGDGSQQKSKGSITFRLKKKGGVWSLTSVE